GVADLLARAGAGLALRGEGRRGAARRLRESGAAVAGAGLGA
ncbi:hypothetical protein GA0115236_14741, partial [Streptomyces sp. IgraMP-1]